ncbi:hypothetical protein TH53_21620 [Pedobacter lusitanus]|uniref:DUF5703 domain-containing protein n=1 Tax=Pedobacter lusitanus TaxID=1503925 RepID=A0A0D0GGQ5_9SPHI|nr:DUF5703 domain-containing protein [Pedobacter lusitanus]KIO75295.1 hypothetical protein TH53_21620 [Pedobacter lusitanus]
MKIKNRIYVLLILLIFCWQFGIAQDKIEDYNVLWTTASDNEAGNMPLGNGSLGSNIWTEKNGDLLLYLSRNDAHSELQRLLKLGRIRISLGTEGFKKKPFRQELDLKTGSILITGGKQGEQIAIRIFMDPDAPVMHINGTSQKLIKIKVTLENWRKEKHQLNQEELASTWVYREGAPKDVATWESADHVLKKQNAIVWYHQNAYSCVPVHLKYQGLESYKDSVNDPLKDNTFGGYIWGDDMISKADTVLQSANNTKKINIRLVGFTEQTPSSGQWENSITTIVKRAASPVKAFQHSQKWWDEFWKRSWIYIDQKDSASVLTQTYILSKYQLACQMRNDFPARFQGGIFNVDPRYAFYATDVREKGYSADYRFYGANYWWQNLRFLYQPQLAQGNADMTKAFFNFFIERIPVFEARAKKYYNASGVYIQECFTTFGLPGMGDFGFGEKEYSEENTRNIWQQNLELTVMMLDYYHYTQDKKFLQEKALLWARKSLEFYQTRFKPGTDGKLRIEPTHALETYWSNVLNDMPSVAGLHYVINELLTLPPELTTIADRDNWKKLLLQLPPVPRKKDADHQWIVDNAESYKNKRTNYEAPDLYCLYPFRIYGFNKANKGEVERAFYKMPNPGRVCWYQTGIFAARLGLAEEAAKDITARSAAQLKGFRFKGYMDSPHDWKPDYDGVGNMMNTMQEMLMYCEGDSIYLFPAWPEKWDVTFKLHAFKNTIIEGTYKDGVLKDFHVFPERRRKDIINMLDMQKE